ncbi:hypothetical protein ISCGN_027239 [Ixodes scapularis]
MQDVQGCLDHPAQQKLAGGTASDLMRCGPVLEQYPGHLRSEIPGLALLELVLDGLDHPLGCTIGSGVVRRNQHPADPIPLQPVQVLGAGESGTIVGHNNVRQSLRREDLPQRRNGRACRGTGDWQCLHPLGEGVHYHQEVVALEGSRIVHVQAGPRPLWERPGGDLHVARGSLVLLADLAALHLVHDVLVQARPPNVRPCHHLGLFNARMPRVQQLQHLGPQTLWNHHPGTPQEAALLQAQLGGLVAVRLVTQLLPSGNRLDHLRQDRVPAGRLRHRSPGEHPRVGPLQQEHVSWLWNGSRHLRQGQAAQGVGRSQVLPRAVDQLVPVGCQRQGPAYHTRRGLHWDRLVRSQQPQQRLVVRDCLELPAPQVLMEALDPEDEGQAFLVELAVALLRRMKPTRSKRHRAFLTILTPVRQDGSYPVRRRIHGEDYRLGRVEVHQHWSLNDQLLAALEGQVLLLLPGPLLTVTKQSMQRLQMRRQVGQEPPVEVDEAEVALKLLLALGLRRLEHGLNLAGCPVLPHVKHCAWTNWHCEGEWAAPQRLQAPLLVAILFTAASVDGEPAARAISLASFAAASIASAAFTASSSEGSGSSRSRVCMAGLLMPQTNRSRSSESNWSPKAQVLANPRSAATNCPRVSPSWRLRLLKRNRSISVDGAGLKCERSVASSSPSVLTCGVAGLRRSSRRLKTRVPQLARKMSRCFASGVSFARKNTWTCSS